jgi:hypothetical protein
MSDEQPPPQLRLRPRKRDDEASSAAAPDAAAPIVPPPMAPIAVPPAPEAPVPPAVVPASEASPLRFRLKPKLTGEAESKEPAVAADPAVRVPPVASEPAPTPPADAAGAGEIPRLKLKPLVAPETPAAAVDSVPSPAPAAVPPPPIPAFPVVQPVNAPPLPEVPVPMVGGLPPPGLPVSESPPSLRLQPPPPPPPPVPVPSPYKTKPKARRSPVMLGVVAGAVLLLAGGGAYFFLMQPDAGVQANSFSPPSGEGSLTAPSLVAVPRPPTVQIAPLPPPPTALQAVASKPEEANAIPAAPVATPAFRAWVNDARVSGVRSGSSTMAIINGRLARPGDMVDAAEGIVFDGVDSAQKLLNFRARNGATLTKPY